MKRMKIKRRIKKGTIIWLIILAIVFGVFSLFQYFSTEITPSLLSFAAEKVTPLITNTINETITQEISDSLTNEDFFVTTIDKDGYIATIDFNTANVNKVLSAATTTATTTIEALEDQILYKLPVGIPLNNTFLTNLFPKIPVKATLIGNIISNIKTNITDYGINSSMIEVYIELTVSLKIILPFESETRTITTSIPVAMKIVQGKVPEFYAGGSILKSTTKDDSN